VQAEDPLHVRILECSFVPHPHAAGPAFFGRLKQQLDRSRQALFTLLE